MVGQRDRIGERDPAHAEQRELERDDAQAGVADSMPGRGNSGGLAAEERITGSAETVAAEVERG